MTLSSGLAMGTPVLRQSNKKTRRWAGVLPKGETSLLEFKLNVKNFFLFRLFLRPSALMRSIVYPSRRNLPPRTRIVIEFLAE
jgi:hypothetical protein